MNGLEGDAVDKSRIEAEYEGTCSSRREEEEVV